MKRYKSLFTGTFLFAILLRVTAYPEGVVPTDRIIGQNSAENVTSVVVETRNNMDNTHSNIPHTQGGNVVKTNKNSASDNIEQNAHIFPSDQSQMISNGNTEHGAGTHLGGISGFREAFNNNNPETDFNVNDVTDTNVGNAFNFHRDDHVGQIPGVRYVGIMNHDDINNNLGENSHVFPGKGGQASTDEVTGHGAIPGVRYVGIMDNDAVSTNTVFNNDQRPTGDTGNDGMLDDDIFVHVDPYPYPPIADEEGQAVFDGATWVDDGNLEESMNNRFVPFNGGWRSSSWNTADDTSDPGINTDDVNTEDMNVVDGNGVTSEAAIIDSVPTDATWNPMNCYINGKVYEEGSGVRSSSTPCMMYICELGQIKSYPTACYMNGICHNEGDKWKSGCTEYACTLTSVGYRSVEIYKECPFQKNNGVMKCVKDGESVKDGPCKMRQCKVSKVNDHFIAELPLVQDVGGCANATGCHSLGEVWTYHCVTQRCISDGYNFIKFPLHARCISRGRCYDNGQSYTTQKTCITRTCFVNSLIHKAWFQETERGCRFENMCIGEGDKQIRKCSEYTCTRMVTSNGGIKMAMKRTSTNACDKAGGY